MTRAHKELKPSDIVAIVDTREQRPWSLSPLKSIRGTLPTGDYSVMGLTNEIAIERKSLSDLLGCIGTHRDRFDDEVKRLLAYPTRCLIVECTWEEFTAGNWRSKISPSAAMGSVLGWIATGIPILFAGGASEASECAARILFIAARRRFYELGSFYEGLKISGEDKAG